MRLSLICLVALLTLTGCSGVETIPDDTGAFVATGYTRYVWRSGPPSPGGQAATRIYEADQAIRGSVDARMAELGYQRVSSRDNAQFMVDYVAAAGFNEGRLSRTASNVQPYPSTTINRQADGATVDNAYALGGVKETGNIMLVFLDAGNSDPLWRVRISTVMEDANRVDPDAVRRAMSQGLSTLPPAR